MTLAPPDPIDEFLVAIAAWGLPRIAPAATNAVALPAGSGPKLVAAAEEHRVIGLLGLAVDSGEVDLEDEVRALAAERHRRALVWCLRLEVQLLHLVDRLASVGIEPVVLKGPAIAHLDEVEPSLRTFADLDLLIPGSGMDEAVAVLTADGAVRSWAERRPGFDRRFAKSVTMRYPDGVEIDLHRSLCDGVHGFRIPLDELVGQQVSMAIAGRDVFALSRVHRILHTAYHLVLGSQSPRLMSLRDLASHLVDPTVDHAAVVDEARRWQGEEVLAQGVAACLDRLGVAAPAWQAWVAERPVDPAEAAIVERQRLEGSAIGRGKIQAMQALPGIRPRLAYAWALAVPARAHLQSRGLRRRDLLVGR